MCDLEPDFLIAEFKKAAATFKPAEILRWNGMSWDYLSIALSLPEDSISKGDRADLVVKFACNAVASAACFELGLGVIPKVLKWRRRDRSTSLIEAMASFKMPPEPGPTGYGEYDGIKFDVVPEDTHRVQRRRAISAALLLRIEKDLDWRPTPAEFEEIARRAGARIRTAA